MAEEVKIVNDFILVLENCNLSVKNPSKILGICLSGAERTMVQHSAQDEVAIIMI